MSTCPHCGMEIEPARRPRTPWINASLAPVGVNLGCGSMIFIALIVALCSGLGPAARFDAMDHKLNELTTTAESLEKKIDEVRKLVEERANDRIMPRAKP